MGERIKYSYTHLLVWLVSIMVFVAIVYIIATTQQNVEFSSKELSERKAEIIRREVFGNAPTIAGLMLVLLLLAAIGAGSIGQRELDASAKPGERGA